MNDMHQLHHASGEDFVSRLHTAMLAMRSSSGHIRQAKQSDAGASFELSDANGQADAECDLAGDAGKVGHE